MDWIGVKREKSEERREKREERGGRTDSSNEGSHRWHDRNIAPRPSLDERAAARQELQAPLQEKLYVPRKGQLVGQEPQHVAEQAGVCLPGHEGNCVDGNGGGDAPDEVSLAQLERHAQRLRELPLSEGCGGGLWGD